MATTADQAEARAGIESTAATRSARTAVRRRLPALALALGVFALVVAPGVSAIHGTGRAAPRLADPSKTAKPLVNRFFVLLVHKDRAGLQRFLSPAFQVQRADGSGAGKKQYLTSLATINQFQITKLKATQTAGALVVRYLAEVEGVLNGKRYTPGPAPRLSAFNWNGKRWQLVAHANFNPLTG
jgi:hypothetical protein